MNKKGKKVSEKKESKKEIKGKGKERT